MANLELLDARATTRKLRELLKSSGVAQLAVAFWGDGATAQLGLSKRSFETRILCDLFSGGCNPDEIAKLLVNTATEVRYVDRLHAKVYCTAGGL